jgi:hypothetical protein
MSLSIHCLFVYLSTCVFIIIDLPIYHFYHQSVICLTGVLLALVLRTALTQSVQPSGTPIGKEPSPQAPPGLSVYSCPLSDPMPSEGPFPVSALPVVSWLIHTGFMPTPGHLPSLFTSLGLCLKVRAGDRPTVPLSCPCVLTWPCSEHTCSLAHCLVLEDGVHFLVHTVVPVEDRALSTMPVVQSGTEEEDAGPPLTVCDTNAAGHAEIPCWGFWGLLKSLD